MEPIKLDFTQILKADNIAELLAKDQLDDIGAKVVKWFNGDDESRSEWKKKNDAAMRLAMQVAETKTFPWPNAANVKFPLLTIAALQFSARVYPALIKAPDLVKYRIMGRDPDGKKASRAYRVSKYMSYQLLDEDEQWEEDQDKLMIALPIVGCMFKKTMYDPMLEKNRSRIIYPKNLVVHYYAKDLERTRVTEVFDLFPSEIKEKQLRKLYVEYDITHGSSSGRVSSEEVDQRQGISPPPDDYDTPREMLECHCFWDLDGDGLKEPYVVTVDKVLGTAVRIKTRFAEVVSQQSLQIQQLAKQIFLLQQSIPPPEAVAQMKNVEQQTQAMLQIRQMEQQIMALQAQAQQLAQQPPSLIRIAPKVHFTKYSFIPSPDGGYYDLGFGQLLGPINDTVDTLINQLLDAGTMQVGSQGFIGKGARIQGGRVKFEPFEWKRVAVAGATLKDSLVPLPINSPSPVLFQLLGMMVQYAERIGSVSEIMQGENPGQNTPAYNMSAMLEQGLQVFNGVFKRIYRSFRSELRKVYSLNSEFLDPQTYFETLDGEFNVLQNDFSGDPKDLVPAADPNAFSNMEKLMKAQFLAQRAQTVPGYNPVAIEKRLLEDMDIPDVQEVYPLTPDGKWVIPPPPNPDLEIQKADMQRRTIEGKIRGETDAARAHAEVLLKEAQAQQIYSELQNAGQPDAADKIKLIAEQMKTIREENKGRMDLLMKQMDIIMKQREMDQQEQEHELEMKSMDKQMEVEHAKAESAKTVAANKAKQSAKKPSTK